ncbi:hypothetical protein N7540_000790 [Penicillium herquei]|nr:hypothetical protein N7540_000790 [Penicillium herquei]
MLDRNEKDPEGSPDIREPSENEHEEEFSNAQSTDLIYEGEEEPEIHLRTYFALAAMFLLNMVQVFCLMGPPAGVSLFRANLQLNVTNTPD